MVLKTAGENVIFQAHCSEYIINLPIGNVTMSVIVHSYEFEINIFWTIHRWALQSIFNNYYLTTSDFHGFSFYELIVLNFFLWVTWRVMKIESNLFFFYSLIHLYSSDCTHSSCLVNKCALFPCHNYIN